MKKTERFLKFIRLFLIILTLIFVFKEFHVLNALAWALYGISWSLPQFMGITKEVYLK